jgi:hypothetical protein
MQLKSPLETVAAALHHACLVALPALLFEVVDNKAAFTSMSPEERQDAYAREHQGERVFPRKQLERRPQPSECVVLRVFPQLWGKTSLGFGGLGGAAMRWAYTTVIRGPGGVLVVYWNSKPAYVVDPRQQTPQQYQAFTQDLNTLKTVSQAEAVDKYGVKPFQGGRESQTVAPIQSDDYEAEVQSPLDALAAALHHAVLLALPDVLEEEMDHLTMLRQTTKAEGTDEPRDLPKKTTTRRPLPQECTVWAMFPQGWLSTAMGDGGVGGQMSTSAYATVIHGPDQTVAVYWQGRFAYRVRLSAASMAERENFEGDLTRGCLADNREAVARYGAET